MTCLNINIRNSVSTKPKSMEQNLEKLIIAKVAKKFHVRWVPCHYGVARPQVADGGEGLQIWRVAANILNKQSRTADKGWSSSLEVARRACKNLVRYEIFQSTSEQD